MGKEGQLSLAKIHVVAPGEHLSQIAESHGFASFNPIWRFTANAELRERRKNPLQLVAGDELQIPDLEIASFPVTVSGGPHRFVLKREQLSLRLQVSDIFGDPIAETDGVLSVDSTNILVHTDNGGKFSVQIPRSTRAGTLKIAGYILELEIGSLDPPEEPSGKWGRFVNLGDWLGVADDSREDPEIVQVATELFQQRQGKTPTGEDDSGTLVAELEQAHDVDVA